MQSASANVPLVFLGEGMQMVKYSRSGKPSSFHLRYRSDTQTFEWDSSSKRSHETSIMLGDIAAVTTGAQAHTRPSSKRDVIDLHKKARCFTIKYFKSDPAFHAQLVQARQAYLDSSSMSFPEQQKRKMTLDHLELLRKHRRDSAAMLELDLEPLTDSYFNLCVNTIRNLLQEYERNSAAYRSQETEAEIAFRQPDEPVVLRHPSAPPIVMDQQQMNPISRIASLSSNSSSSVSSGVGSNMNSPSSANSGRGLEGQLNQSAPPPIPNSRRPALVDRPRSHPAQAPANAEQAWPDLQGHQQAAPQIMQQQQPAMVSPASVFVNPSPQGFSPPPAGAPMSLGDMDNLLRTACDPSLGYIPNWNINRVIFEVLARNSSKVDEFLVETCFFNLLTSPHHSIALQALLLFEYLAENVPRFKDAKCLSNHAFIESNFVKQLPRWSRKPIKFAQDTFGYKSWFNVLGNEAQRGKIWNEQHEPVAMLRWNKVKEIITKLSRDNSHPSSTMWRVAAFKLHLGGAFDDVSPLRLPDGRVMKNPLEGMWAPAVGVNTTSDVQRQQYQLQQQQQQPQPQQQQNGHWPYAQPLRPVGNVDLPANDWHGDAAVAQQAALLRHYQEKREQEELRAAEQAQRHSLQHRERAHSLPQAQQPNMFMQHPQQYNPAPLPVVPPVVPPAMPPPVLLGPDQLPPRALAPHPAQIPMNNQLVEHLPFDQVNQVPFATPCGPPVAAPASLQSRRYFNSQSQLVGGNLVPPPAQTYKGPGILDGDSAHFQCVMNLVSDDIQLLHGLLRSTAQSEWSESKMVALCHDISGIQTDLQNAVHRCTAMNAGPAWFTDTQLDLLLNIIERIHDILKMHQSVSSRRASYPPQPVQPSYQQPQPYQPQYPSIAAASSAPVPVQRQRSYPESKEDFEEEEKTRGHHVINSRPPFPDRSAVASHASSGAYVAPTSNAAAANAIRPPAFAPRVVVDPLPVAASAPFEHTPSAAPVVASPAPTSKPLVSAVSSPSIPQQVAVTTAPKIPSNEGVVSPQAATRTVARPAEPVQNVSHPAMSARPLNVERVARSAAPQPPATSSAVTSPIVAVHRIDLSTASISPGRSVAPTASARAAAALAASQQQKQREISQQHQQQEQEEPAETNGQPGLPPARATANRHAMESSTPSHPVLSGLAFPAADILAFNSATVTTSSEGRTKRAVSAKKKPASSSIAEDSMMRKSSLEDSFFQQPLEDLRLDLEGSTISNSHTIAVSHNTTTMLAEGDHGAIKLHAKAGRAKKKEKPAAKKPIVMNY